MRNRFIWCTAVLGGLAIFFASAPVSAAHLRIEVEPDTAGALALLVTGLLGFWHNYHRQASYSRTR